VVTGAAAGSPPAPVLAILGPTGVGKTRLAVELAACYPIEVVSVDSRQVYRGMDVGTGKPTAAERALVRHHLLDVADPDEPYDAARFARDAAAAIDDIRRRGRWPALVGGTGLYYRALVRGLHVRPPADPAVRAELRAEARAHGAAALHRRLHAVDPAGAAALHPHDTVRVIRALEVVLLTGAPLAATAGAAWSGRAEGWPYRVLAVGLTAPRAALYAALDRRVERMLAEGLLAEVRALLAAGFAATLPAMQGIGYRHLAPVAATGRGLEAAVAAMKRDTRRYAKRQWTWFAREPGLSWIEVRPGELGPARAEIARRLEQDRPFEAAG
jgi:tRNA dimethylallyltransferase